jgi:hypothetical protein
VSPMASRLRLRPSLFFLIRNYFASLRRAESRGEKILAKAKLLPDFINRILNRFVLL